MTCWACAIAVDRHSAAASRQNSRHESHKLPPSMISADFVSAVFFQANMLARADTRRGKAAQSCHLSIRTILRTLRPWLIDHVCRFWLARIHDPAGGFFENLDALGAPVATPRRTTLVQARLTYVFSHAYLLSGDPAFRRGGAARPRVPDARRARAGRRLVSRGLGRRRDARQHARRLRPRLRAVRARLVFPRDRRPQRDPARRRHLGVHAAAACRSAARRLLRGVRAGPHRA